MTSLTDQAHFLDYWPPDFGWPHQEPDLVPFQFDGVNFGQCARDVHGLFTALLTELVPHIPGGLKSGSCWSYSATDDLPTGWSFHHFGIAMDVNWNVNHMGTNIPDPHGEWAIPRATATAVARKYGCEWGGNWSGGFHDDMHFECHLSPAVARTVTGPLEDEMALLPDERAALLRIDKQLNDGASPLNRFLHRIEGDNIADLKIDQDTNAEVHADGKKDGLPS